MTATQTPRPRRVPLDAEFLPFAPRPGLRRSACAARLAGEAYGDTRVNFLKTGAPLARARSANGSGELDRRTETMTDFADLATRYLVLIEGGPPSNYSAWSPDLPGCVATGDTLEEAEREMRAAIAFHLEGLMQDGDAIPDPSGPGVCVERTKRPAA